MTKKRVAYIVTIALAVMYITLGNRIVTKRSNTVGSSEDTLVNAKVTKWIALFIYLVIQVKNQCFWYYLI